ncbi:hypothetical protein KP77_11140 [Jeotgalibacillus alimentarius]|uniref:YhfM-like domain-containing protein n=1 Tax=Jeotgalibacillus alimentarius TaxID=135826 RepID=A0A0C2VRQ9_9BACL|nr:hypothetical protein [Jeotgalibacillus alimentarius]KIL51602.1 hypothetical protein KP77_11140 [Jeotgalibacillus alimentarius]
MKKITIFISLVVFSILFATGCSSADIEKIDVYEMESFSIIKEDSLTSYTDSKDVNIFIKVFNNAKKEPGIVDIADPEYQVQIGEESYYLWIKEEQGTIMNVNDTHTIYSLSKNSVEKVYDLLN